MIWESARGSPVCLLDYSCGPQTNTRRGHTVFGNVTHISTERETREGLNNMVCFEGKKNPNSRRFVAVGAKHYPWPVTRELPTRTPAKKLNAVGHGQRCDVPTRCLPRVVCIHYIRESLFLCCPPQMWTHRPSCTKVTTICGLRCAHFPWTRSISLFVASWLKGGQRGCKRSPPPAVNNVDTFMIMVY